LRALGQRQPAFPGIAPIVIGGAFFASMHAGVRFVSAEIHPFEIAFFRNVFGFMVFPPISGAHAAKLAEVSPAM